MNKKPAHARATELRSMNARAIRRFHQMQSVECFGHVIPLLNTAMPTRFAGVPEFPCTLPTSSVTTTVLVAFNDRVYVSSIRQMISLCCAIPTGQVDFQTATYGKSRSASALEMIIGDNAPLHVTFGGTLGCLWSYDGVISTRY